MIYINGYKLNIINKYNHYLILLKNLIINIIYVLMIKIINNIINMYHYYYHKI